MSKIRCIGGPKHGTTVDFRGSRYFECIVPAPFDMNVNHYIPPAYIWLRTIRYELRTIHLEGGGRVCVMTPEGMGNNEAMRRLADFIEGTDIPERYPR